MSRTLIVHENKPLHLKQPHRLTLLIRTYFIAAFLVPRRAFVITLMFDQPAGPIAE